MLFEQSQLSQKDSFSAFDLSKVDESYREFFKSQKKQEYFYTLQSFLKNEYENNVVFPPSCQIFRAFELTPLDRIKVVILGQDPYHEANQAEGLAFSASRAKNIPASLKNIFKEIKTEYGKTSIAGSDLSFWSRQGVFLLNTILTVRKSQPLSHAFCGWEIFSDNFMSYLAQNKKNVVYMLWGVGARSKKELILSFSNPDDNLIIENVHPSPLSAHRGFFNSNMFIDANQYLVKHSMHPIQW